MNEIDGIVVRIEDDFAWVKTAGAGSACSACGSRSGCGSAGQERLLRLPNPIHARVGDQVVILAEQGAVMRAVWLVYGMPLLLALLGAALLQALTGNEMAAAFGMLAGLAGGFLALRRLRPACGGREQILSIQLKGAIR